MTPSEWRNLRTYDPDYDNPYPELPPVDHGAVERWLAVAFFGVALVMFGFLIGWSLPR